jgi:hypothetical protein
VKSGPSTGLVDVRVADNLTLGVTSHLEKSDTGDDATESVAVTGDLDVLNDNVRALVASTVDGAGLVVTLDGDSGTRVARRLSCEKGEVSGKDGDGEWERKQTLSGENLTGSGEEDGSLEVDGGSGAEGNDGVGTTVV